MSINDFKEIKKRKQEIIDDLYKEIGELNRIWNEQELELTAKEYICKFDELKQRPYDAKKIYSAFMNVIAPGRF